MPAATERRVPRAITDQQARTGSEHFRGLAAVMSKPASACKQPHHLFSARPATHQAPGTHPDTTRPAAPIVAGSSPAEHEGVTLLPRMLVWPAAASSASAVAAARRRSVVVAVPPSAAGRHAPASRQRSGGGGGRRAHRALLSAHISRRVEHGPRRRACCWRGHAAAFSSLPVAAPLPRLLLSQQPQPRPRRRRRPAPMPPRGTARGPLRRTVGPRPCFARGGSGTEHAVTAAATRAAAAAVQSQQPPHRRMLRPPPRVDSPAVQIVSHTEQRCAESRGDSDLRRKTGEDGKGAARRDGRGKEECHALHRRRTGIMYTRIGNTGAAMLRPGRRHLGRLGGRECMHGWVRAPLHPRTRRSTQRIRTGNTGCGSTRDGRETPAEKRGFEASIPAIRGSFDLE